MSFCITTAREIKEKLTQGWELWHLPNNTCPTLPGRWQMRYRNQKIGVHWEAIVQVRQKSLKWFEENTKEIQTGRKAVFCYTYIQGQLQINPLKEVTHG